MIKEHCPDCNSIYIGDTCPCQKGKKPRKLECECGKPAKEIYTDRLGEWPLCFVRSAWLLSWTNSPRCPYPITTMNTRKNPSLRREGIRFRTMEILLTYQSVKNRSPGLLISAMKKSHSSSSYMIETVKSHFKSIRKKLGIRSRYEIPYVLDRAQGVNPPAEELTLPELIDQLPISITITIKKRD